MPVSFSAGHSFRAANGSCKEGSHYRLVEDEMACSWQGAGLLMVDVFVWSPPRC